jgi:hypothetical protein
MLGQTRQRECELVHMFANFHVIRDALRSHSSSRQLPPLPETPDLREGNSATLSHRPMDGVCYRNKVRMTSSIGDNILPTSVRVTGNFQRNCRP